MKTEKELLNKLKELFSAPVQVFTATVTAVDEDNDTIDVVDADEVELFNVRLKSAISISSERMVLIPEIGSSVLVGLIGNTDQALYMVMASQIRMIKANTTDGIIIDDGVNGPVFISQQLIEDINEIKSDLNDIKTVFQNWTPANGDGGAALKLAATAWYGQQLPDTKIEDVTNEKLKH